MINLKKLISHGIHKADIHIHSNHSDGKPSIEEILDYVQEKTDLDVIAITDHNTITGAVEAQRIVNKGGYRFEVVVGAEITAKEGHVLGLYLKEPIQPGLSAKETIERIHEQGGIAIAAHPFFKMKFKSPNMVTMDGVGFKALISENFDAVEIANGAIAPFINFANKKAQLVNATILFKNETGGSDAHILKAIGKGVTYFYGNNAEDLKDSLRRLGYTRGIRNHQGISGAFLYVLFFFPKVVELIKSIFLKDHRKTNALLHKREMEHYRAEKKELEELMAESE